MAPVLAGVVADCTSAPPHGLSVRPADIALACADNGSGVEGMTWTSWKATSAAGHGTFWDKLCQPSCAAGQTGSYPVTVALSVVKTSADGPWFSRLVVTWDGSRPPGTVPVSYGLLGRGTDQADENAPRPGPGGVLVGVTGRRSAHRLEIGADRAGRGQLVR